MIAMNRRKLISVAAGGTVAALVPMATRAQPLSAFEQELYQAGKAKPEVTWYTGQMQAEPSEAAAAAFGSRFPGMKVNVVRSTSQVAFQRLSQDFRAGVLQCDVFSSTDYSHAAFLKREGRLLQYRPQNADGLLEAIRDFDRDNYFQVTYLGLYLLARQSMRVPEGEAPRSWKDLLDPRWRDKLAVGHPGFSGAIGSWCIAMRKMYGWDYFKALEKNRPQVGRSSADPVTTINAGERTVGVCIPSATTLFSASRGNPLALIYPADGSLLVPSPSGILKDAPHQAAAKLFMEFMASSAYSQACLPFYHDSLRADVPQPPGARPLSEIRSILPTGEETEAGMPEVKELWRETFGV
jgi:iron(III) transport system substrate-binding protein